MKSEDQIVKKDRDEMKRRSSGGHPVWYVVGGAALIGIAALVAISIPDIKRYIKISTM